MKKIGDLVRGIEYVLDAGTLDAEISAVAFDSRECSPGTLFFCIPGFTVDGHEFVSEALARGASALVVSRAVEVPAGVTVIVVPDPRYAMGVMSAAFFDNPSDTLKLIGVTGTNGKTSVTYMIDELLRRAGNTTGLLGTIENRIAGDVLTVKRTTPESLDLQFLLSRMKTAGCSDAIMEVSSHAVVLNRIAGAKYRAGIFTNLTQDHLDFHKTMEAYFDAKKKFFADYLDTGSIAVINSDDSSGRRIADGIAARTVFYAIDDESADVRATNLKFSAQGMSFTVESNIAPAFEIKSALMGKFNVYNSLAMIAYGLAAGFAPVLIAESLAAIKGVPGRFESVAEGQDFMVIVDYAHTPDGLENVLRAAREICEGRLIAVFGAGGDRDKSKRPLMGAIAAQLADFVIVTSDNPRSEEPDEIIDQIVQGLQEALHRVEPSKRFKYITETDRFAAIKKAIDNARPGDIILVAGKGHENYQIFKDRTIHFDDREVARGIISERGD